MAAPGRVSVDDVPFEGGNGMIRKVVLVGVIGSGVSLLACGGGETCASLEERMEQISLEMNSAEAVTELGAEMQELSEQYREMGCLDQS
jgi:hypothetical protein